MAQRLPFIPSDPAYRFATTLDGVSFVIDVHWNTREQAWYMDLLDDDETPIRSGIKIVLGALLGARSADDRFPEGTFSVVDTSGAELDATFDDMGVRVQVWYLTSAELSLGSSSQSNVIATV